MKRARLSNLFQQILSRVPGNIIRPLSKVGVWELHNLGSAVVQSPRVCSIHGLNWQSIHQIYNIFKIQINIILKRVYTVCWRLRWYYPHFPRLPAPWEIPIEYGYQDTSVAAHSRRRSSGGWWHSNIQAFSRLPAVLCCPGGAERGRCSAGPQDDWTYSPQPSLARPNHLK